MINTGDSRFATYYAYEGVSTQTTANACCSTCYTDASCYLFDYNVVTKVCTLYSGKSSVTAATGASISSLFYVLNSQHVSGYYGSLTYCATGTYSETTMTNVMLNTADSRFSTYYTYQTATTQATANACCSSCYSDSSCYIYDYNIATRVCTFYSATSSVTAATDASISALFYRYNSHNS